MALRAQGERRILSAIPPHELRFSGTPYPVWSWPDAPMEGISARLAEIRGQLKLLADYL
jgi:hypothetical protein